MPTTPKYDPHPLSTAADAAAGGGRAAWISRLALLCGGLRPHPLAGALRRHVLTLPLSPTRHVADAWADLAAGIPQLRRGPIALLCSTGPGDDWAMEPANRFETICDQSAHRGTAGLLADALGDDGDDWLLVAQGRQIPLPGAASALAEVAPPDDDADVVLLHHGGTLTSLWLLRPRALRDVPAIGYFDFTEQFLGRVADAGRLRHHDVGRALLRPVRTLDAYLDAVADEAVGPRPRRRLDGRPRFGFVEGGEAVADTVRLLDSVVLRGARLDGRCSVVRSVVGSEARVRNAAVVFHQLHV